MNQQPAETNDQPTDDPRETGRESVPTDESNHEVEGITLGSVDTPIEFHEATPEIESASDDNNDQNQDESMSLEALRTQRDELQDRLLRVSADYQNFVRRSHQGTEDACRHQMMQTLKALLTPLDYFDHALAVDLEKTTPQGLLQGVEIVRDEFLKTLEQFGMKRIQVTAGEPFDPTRHEALARQPVEGLEPDYVAEQLQPGYTLGEIVLRPAKVVVTQ